MASGETVKMPMEKKELRKGRPYQDKMVEYAIKENTIVSLGTGAGKTFVAVMLIRELAHFAEGQFTESEGQRIIFLAHTVPLVKQQAEYIRDNTNLKVSEFVGDAKGIDNWPKDTWYNHFKAANVLVFSRAIFLDLLMKAFIKPRQLCLIVFDECHHATKNDPFVQIMKVIKDVPPEERPRILGLSASLLGKKVKPGELQKGVKDLEAILMSTARTAPDMAEVLKFATNPDEKISSYSSALDEPASLLKDIIYPPLVFLQTKISERKGKYALEETAKNLLDDLHHILIDLGPASAAGFVSVANLELRKAIEYTEAVDEWEKHIAWLVLGKLFIFEAFCRQFKTKYGKLHDSNKVKAMLDEIRDTAPVNGEMSESPPSKGMKKEVKDQEEVKGQEEKEEEEEPQKKDEKSSPQAKRALRGIIFAERRQTASCLAKLIQEKRKTEPGLKHVSCDFVVGHNIGQSATAMRKEARMKSSRQEQVLGKFRKGTVNLLIATSVIEEGVDVPRCNLVIRFDLPQNFRSYVQSKGRARDKPSKFVLLLSDMEVNKMGEIGSYHQLETELIELCQSERSLPSEEEIQKKMADIIPPYMPHGTEGARVGLGNSLTLLHRYCGRLPQDEYTKLSPHFEVEKIRKAGGQTQSLSNLSLEEEDEDPNYDYICSLHLPINCPLRTEIIKSPPLGSKHQSERASALFAMEKLHKMGEVDDLFKSKPSADSDDEDVKEEKKQEKAGAGTDKKSSSYRKEIPPLLTGCFDSSVNATGYYAYAFVIKEEESGLLYSKTQGVAILTKKQLPYWMIPAHSLYVKDSSGIEIKLTVTLKPVTQHIPSLTDEELNTYRSFNHNIFTDILFVTPSSLEANFDKAIKDYIIVPVTINTSDGKTVDDIKIDFAHASSIVSYYIAGEKRKPSKPYTPSSLNSCLVTPAYRDSTIPGLQEIFCVEVDESKTPLSSFNYPKFANFVEFFKSKYGYDIIDKDQPALICRRVNTSFLKLFTSRYLMGEPAVKKTDITMFPELVHVLPVSVSFWRVLRCLPAMLWRVESLLIAHELSTRIRKESNIGLESSETLLLTDTSVRGYADSGHGVLPSSRMQYLNDLTPDITEVPSNEKISYSNRGPDNCLILQALTPRGANDSVNLERLELLGDSFLKLITSVYLYNSRPKNHEGKLSEARSRRVANINLFVLGKKKGITNTILSSDFVTGSESFRERLRWVPPGYTTLEESHKVTDKSVADTVEALIGAHTVAGGLEGGITLMKWFGIKINDGSSTTVPPKATSSSNHSLLLAQSDSIFSSHFGSPPTPTLACSHKAISTRNRILSQVSSIQRKIKYSFKNELLLIEAMTHSSYNRNDITGCYQRLEFLGDAILDYLVTCHIYQSDSSAEPGKMTELRSALVCNSRFAELAISLNLHKSLCHGSPNLFNDMRKYAQSLSERNTEDMERKLGEMSINCVESAQVERERKVVVESTCTEGNDDDDDYDDDDDDDDIIEPPKSLSDCFEALAGAVFIDSGMNLQTVWEAFSRFLEPLFEKFKDDPPLTPICELHKLIPENLKVQKKVLSEGRLLCIIEIKDKDICESATARSYKNAKNFAASKVLKKLTEK